MRADGETVPLGRKPLALLAYLARRQGENVPRDTLCGLIWPDNTEDQARANLRQTLSALRRSFGTAAAALDAAHGAVALDPETVWCDLWTFAEAAGRGDTEALAEAAALACGEFLEGLGPVSPEFDRWLDTERAELRAARTRLLEAQMRTAREAGDSETVLAASRAILALDPLREPVHRDLMRTLAGQGRHDAALKQFETLTRLLDAELGVAPDAETVALARDIRARRQRPAAGSAGNSEPMAQSPEAPVPRAPARRASIAVLPFRVLSRDDGAVYFGEGIAEDIIIELSRDRGLMVISRHSSFQYDEGRHAPDQIGQDLGVRYFLSGSVRMMGPQVRVAAHLVRADDGQEVWAERYDRKIEDIFEIQTDIARTVSASATGRLAEAEARAAAGRPDAALQVYDLVLRGLSEMNRMSEDGWQKAETYFARAMQADPGYGRAKGLWALATIYLRWGIEIDDDMVEILPVAEAAVKLDPRDSKAQCAMGIALLINRDFDRARHHFEAGLEANPNDDLLLTEYARYEQYVDRAEDGLRRIREAFRLNPFHPVWYWNIYGRCLHLLDRHAEAVACFRRVTDPPFYVWAYLAACLHALGDAEGRDAAKARLFEAKPDFSLARWSRIFPYKSPETAKRFFESFRAAGL